jgi:hypothetical protein
MSQHSYKRKKSNAHLRFALAKYGDTVQKSIIASGLDRETAEWIERMLRSFPNMGWNIAKGGNVPPSPKGKVRSAKYCANISAAKQGNKNPMFGKKIIFSAEHRKNLSIANKMLPPVKCPHCGKEGRANCMKRWHFDRCRHVNK